MKLLNNSNCSATNEIVANENVNKTNEEEESDDTGGPNRDEEYNVRCHDDGIESNFNCQLINNNTIESFDYRICRIDSQNRISYLKGRHNQETMRKEKTLKKQFSIQAEHDYHEKISEEKIKMGERVGEVDSNEQSTCDNVTVSVVNGSDTDWDTSKEVSDGGLSKPLISYQINECDVTKQKSDDEKIDAKDNISINYNDYRYFYSDNYKNSRDLENYHTIEYYAKSDVMFNEQQREYTYQNSSEFNNNEIVTNDLRQQSEEMFLMQNSFQNSVMHKDINQVIEDTLKTEDESHYNNYMNFQNGSSSKDDGSSDSSQDEKLNSKILNLSNIKYNPNSRVTSVLTSTNQEFSGSYLNERIPIINSNELPFEQSPSPNGQLQSLDSPPVSRSLNVISSVGDAGVRYENSNLTSSSTVLQCLNPMTTSAPSGSVLQSLSPHREISNSDCDTQVCLHQR